MATAQHIPQVEIFAARKPARSEHWWNRLFPAAPKTQALVASSPAVNLEEATPAELLRIAVSQKADVDTLNKLMDLQERWQKNEAKKAYVVAMNAFKANPPEITKNELAKFTSINKYGKEIEVEWWYSTLDHIHNMVLSALSKHGISHRWITEQPKPEIVRVSCILTHKLGHSVQTTLEGPVDHSGSKNAIQAIGSTAKYLERYTLMAATGLADSSPDVDGNAPAANAPDPKLTEAIKRIRAARTSKELREIFTKVYSASQDAKEQSALIDAKDARLRELR